MAGIKSTSKERLWREILQRQADSGQSVRRFCASEGISEPSFYAWRRRLRERNSIARPQKASCCEDEDGRNHSQLFVPLQLIDTAATLEIVHPLGYRIQLIGDVNPVALRHVIEALDERGGR